MIRAALDEVVRFVVCPYLVDELREVLHRDRFRRYFTIGAADVYTDSVEAASELTDDPVNIPRVSRDPDDDYLVALARDAGVHAIISGDDDLDVEAGPVRLTPRDVLDQLRLGEQERRLLLTALRYLRQRIEAASTQEADDQLTIFVEDVRTAAQTLGGDPDEPNFGATQIDDVAVDIRDLGRTERTACAYALELDRQTGGQLHAEHLGSDRLPLAFEIVDRHVALDRILTRGT